MSRFSHHPWRGGALAVILAFTASTAIAQEDMARPMPPDTLEWGAAPPSLPEGAELAVLEGNPMEAGSFVMRLRFPDGYAVAPHTHPTAEHVTVLSGALLFAHGDDPASAEPQEIGAGGFIKVPADHPHRAEAQGETVIQIHGEGPFSISYLDPADDPQGQSN
ncbi:cupin domain-containing protein [Limimaricola sp.]|uniref:cupin domain-containing protein n=1 Tax=Limimaricola sp. TaxID=2211665 RepID=UPI004058F3EC